MWIKVYDYKFIPPPILSTEEYSSYKLLLKFDPKKSLCPPNDLLDHFGFKKVLKIALGSLVLILLSSFIFDGGPNKPMTIITGIFSVVFFLLASFFVIGFLANYSTIENYQEYLKIRRKHFEKIRTSVLKTNSYDEFCLEMIKIHDARWIIDNLSNRLSPQYLESLKEKSMYGNFLNKLI
jgi:hypothetical protein